jgi:hypothetical protein
LLIELTTGVLFTYLDVQLLPNLSTNMTTEQVTTQCVLTAWGDGFSELLFSSLMVGIPQALR